jgi:hypothetical protein
MEITTIWKKGLHWKIWNHPEKERRNHQNLHRHLHQAISSNVKEKWKNEIISF